MNKNLQLTVLSLCLSLGLSAQTNKQITGQSSPHAKCGTEVPSKEWDEAFNKLVDQHKIQSAKGAVVGYTIPVIVHLIHNGVGIGTYPNLGANQINSQIAVLNADFGGTGWNVGNLAATAFSAVGASNTEIRFCAATKNPIGQTLPEPGIHRVKYQDSSWSDPHSFTSNASLKAYMDGTIKPRTIWDPTRYFNIWVTDADLTSIDLLGYATFPAGAALSGLPGVGSQTTDGIWVYAQTYGNIGFLSPGNALGRVAVHEVGHWLGLRHIGGDGNNNPAGDCAATDFCNDTPPQSGGNLGGQYGQNFGSPTYPLHAGVCGTVSPNGDMFMNFMDYTDDGAKYMYTPDQKTRMQTAMATGIYRSGLNASAAFQCSNPASTPTCVTYMASNVCNTVGVITTTNVTIGNPIPSYFWTSTPSAGVVFTPNGNAATPTITFPSAGVYTITCAAVNTVGTNSSNNIVVVDACDVGITKNFVLKGYVSLQPNPSNGKVNVIVNLPLSQNLQINVMNVLGQSVYTSKHSAITSGNFEIDLTSYSSGVYFVSIDNGKEKVVKRLILNK